MATGLMIETLSKRKLIIIGIFLLLVQIAFYIIGEVIAPKPFFVENVLSRTCKQPDRNAWAWFENPAPTRSCPQEIQRIDYNKGYSIDDLVFVFQFPRMRDGQALTYSRWHKAMRLLLTPSIDYDRNNPLGPAPALTLDVRIGSRDASDSNWKQVDSMDGNGQLDCSLPRDEFLDDGMMYMYDCKPLHLYELSHLHHDFYLVNIRIPSDNIMNTNPLLSIKEFELSVVAQTGSFTKLCLSLKCVMFPLVLATMIWFGWRLRKFTRPTYLLEKVLFALAMAMLFLNLPLEFLSLLFYLPYMSLFDEVRQALFYSFLFCFWIIFIGEHTKERLDSSNLKVYWKQLSGIIVGCACVFGFLIGELGVQLQNPWKFEKSKRITTFLVIFSKAAFLYLILFAVMTVYVFKKFRSKIANLEHASKGRCKLFQGAICRFRLVLLATTVCALLTVVHLILGIVDDVRWKLISPDLKAQEHAAAFRTGVYGMWNIYVIALLILYAPSNKKCMGSPLYQECSLFSSPPRPPDSASTEDGVEDSGEVMVNDQIQLHI